MKFYQTACLATVSLLATAIPSIAQNSDVEGRMFQRSEQNTVNLGTGITSINENEQFEMQNLYGTAIDLGSSSVTGEIIQDDRQNVGNIGNDIFSIHRSRTTGVQDLDGS